MPCPHIRKCVNIIHLHRRQRLCRRILHDIQMRTVWFHQPLSAKRIRILILCIEASCIRFFLFFYLFKRRQFHCIIDGIETFHLYDRSVQIGEIFHRDPRIQRLRDLDDRTFSHPVGNDICAGIQEDRPFYPIGPVVIMRKSPKTCLDPSENDRRLLVCLPDQISIDHRRIIRTLSHHTARCIRVGRPAFFRDRIVIDHGIHIAGGNKKRKPWLSKHRDAFFVLPIRLGDDPNPIPSGFQHMADDRMSKGRMIHISVSDHIDKINLIPSPFFHLFSVDRQKSCTHSFLHFYSFSPVKVRRSSSVSARYSPVFKFSSSTRLPIRSRFR